MGAISRYTVNVSQVTKDEKNRARVSFFLTSYLVPLVLICGLYLGMLLRLWHGVAPGGHVSAESRRGKKRVTRMVVVVVVIFAVCWCPIQVILVLKTLDQYEITNTTVMLQIASHVLAYMNSCVNPILYAFLSDNFRKAFRKVIACGPVSGARGSGTRYHRASVNQANGRVDADNKTCNTKTTRHNGSRPTTIYKSPVPPRRVVNSSSRRSTIAERAARSGTNFDKRPAKLWARKFTPPPPPPLFPFPLVAREEEVRALKETAALELDAALAAARRGAARRGASAEIPRVAEETRQGRCFARRMASRSERRREEQKQSPEKSGGDMKGTLGHKGARDLRALMEMKWKG
ncbi:G-protein coupled receptor moody [Gryllus bimaculatus]|nr:G-protein coupled receptor moody [Gryllus bimaculatus]